MKKIISFAIAFALVFSSMAYVCTQSADAAAFRTTSRVTGVKLSAQSYSSIKLSWSKYKNAKGYKIYRATKKTGKYKLIKTTTLRSYTNKGLKAKTRYYYKVRAYKVIKKKTKYSKYSSVKSAVTKAKPQPVPSVKTCSFKIRKSDGTEQTCTKACISGSDYCEEHTCGKDGCIESVYALNDVTYEYCTNHICKFMVKDEQGKSRYCGRLCAEGSKCCETHSCSVEGCNETVMSNGTAVSIYCANHGCKLVRQGGYCTKSVYKNGYCKDHLCPVCEKMMKTEGSNFCSCCRCTLDGCDNPRKDGAEGNDRMLGFKCCDEHQCSYVMPNWDELIAPYADLEDAEKEAAILKLARHYGVDENGRCVGVHLEEGLEYCVKHLCKGCYAMPPTPGYTYCTCCRCTLEGCDNPKIGGPHGGEFKFKCCTDHQCTYVISDWETMTNGMSADEKKAKAIELGVDLNGRCVKTIFVEGSSFCTDHRN